MTRWKNPLSVSFSAIFLLIFAIPVTLYPSSSQRNVLASCSSFGGRCPPGAADPPLAIEGARGISFSGRFSTTWVSPAQTPPSSQRHHGSFGSVILLAELDDLLLLGSFSFLQIIDFFPGNLGPRQIASRTPLLRSPDLSVGRGPK